MTRNFIKYGGLALVLVGIIIVMSNLFTSDTEWKNDKKNTNSSNKDSYYSAKISLLDKETNAFISGANMVVKNEEGTVVSGWTTEESVHLITNLKNGTYTLVQESTTNDYHLNSDVVTFKIKNQDENVVMYNIQMTSEEKANQATEQNKDEASNTTSSEIGVENTASSKNIFSYIISVFCIVFGIKMIYFKKEKNLS